ncbi:UNVERIFIED_CONTAM: RHS repeat-associated protein [Acetivibrio alkalicellulosi]
MGNMTLATQGDITTTYKYYKTGMLEREIDQSTNTVKDYDYDLQGNRRLFKLTHNNDVVINTNYKYDKMNRLEEVYENGKLIATYKYDANGNRQSLTYQNNNRTEYKYNLANILERLTNYNGDVLISDYNYTYYLDGNRESENNMVSKRVVNYLYDDLARLKRENEVLNGRQIETKTYTYDDYSNRETMTIEGKSVTRYKYDLNNRVEEEVKTPLNSNEIEEMTIYSYDDNGNQVFKEVIRGKVENPVYTNKTEYRYDSLNRLTKVLENDEIYTYSYRADGLRHEKNINGEITTFIWDGQNTVGEINGNKELINKYIRGINLIYMDDLSDQMKFYLFNGHGDVVHLTDEEGEVVRNYNYDAFGNQEKILFGDLNGDGLINSTDIVLLRRYLLEIIKDFPSENGKVAADLNGDGLINSTDIVLLRRYILNITKNFMADKNMDGYVDYNEIHESNRDTNPFRYCGEYFDEETGTIYLRARYYNPRVGRFISEDSYWGSATDPLSLNLYTYCANNPVFYIDPSGFDAIILQDTTNSSASIMGDTCLLLQDKNGTWYFFQYAFNAVMFFDVEDYALESLDELNKYIGTNFNSSTYIKGDFSKSHGKAYDIYWDWNSKNKRNNLYIPGSELWGKSGYNLLWRNCTTVSYSILTHGVLNDGTRLTDLSAIPMSRLTSNNIIPNINYIGLKRLFMNDAFTLKEYETQLNNRKEKLESRLRNNWYKLLHGAIKEDISWIDRLLN